MIRLSDYNRGLEDFKRDFISTWLKFTRDKTGESFYGYVRALEFTDDTKSRWNLYVWRMKQLVGDIINGEEYTFTPWFPEPKIYNTDHECFTLAYNPRRQYKRALSEEICSLSILDWYGRFNHPYLHDLSLTNYQVYKAISDDVQIPVKTGLAQILNSERVGFALFDNFHAALHPQQKDNTIIVFANDTAVGQMNDDATITFLEPYNSILTDVFEDNDIKVAA